MIGERFNFEDVFFRDLTVCVLDTLEGQIKWNNRFTSGDVFVQVPIYYSLTGDERFLLDSFSDDIVSENRYVELNTDIIPRGHLTMTGFNIKSDEFANPNVWLRMVIENEKEIRKVLSKVRAVPITVNYDLEILLSSEIDTFKCSQAIMNTLWIYKFMYFEHNFMNIDAVLLMPDNNTVQMVREKNLTSDNKISLKVSFTVETYYPAWRPDRVTDVGYVNPVDPNDYVNQLTLNFLISKTQLNKLNKLKQKEFDLKPMYDKDRITNLFNKLLNNNKPDDLLEDVQTCFDAFIEKSIYYLEIHDKNADIQNERNDFEEDKQDEEEENFGEDEEEDFGEDEEEDFGEDGEDEDFGEEDDFEDIVSTKVFKKNNRSKGVEDIQKLPLDWFNTTRQNYKINQIIPRKKEIIFNNAPLKR